MIPFSREFFDNKHTGLSTLFHYGGHIDCEREREKEGGEGERGRGRGGEGGRRERERIET